MDINIITSIGRMNLGKNILNVLANLFSSNNGVIKNITPALTAEYHRTK